LGSQDNIIPGTELLQIKPLVTTKQRIRLKAYSGEAIATSGICTLVLEVVDKSHKVSFVIVKVEKPPIHGLKSCNLLGLMKRVHIVNGEMTKVEDTYAGGFQDRGNVKV
jgi:hypothetical protein